MATKSQEAVVALPKTIRSLGQLALTEALISERKRAGLTQAGLAERLRCHQSLLARLESGERRVDVIELIVIARAIGVSPEDIVKRVAENVPAGEAI